MKCSTKHCRNRARTGRRRCNKCRMRIWRERHPVRAAWHKIKWSAKLRGIEFGLTFEEFSLFDDLTGYVAQMGNGAQSMTIDRIDETRGYFLDNLQILANADNVRKSNHFRRTRGKREFSPAPAQNGKQQR